ncbi:single-stranded nucleic acid binding protein [Deferribacter desulfuricans SSM1]|uniref:RNA-binding protein KhpB n=1 Tax=Deferribacter desulfuricans (strain DSM 14783 / JCM 11476 / NBRC 101012 / SSM1) TaxID=639282 RepID=D3PB78_DEFDS|nr:RNA-binding cell elongation regulator Jag/EloR [Deferribacter desulfuricans]BAI79851.1 single-stranded nucleic acid binding protein [Deferribacter desulfuricans SSM1]
MKYYEVEGSSVEEALNTFLIEHDIPREFVEVEVIEKGAKGILGFGKKNAKIKIKFDENEYLKRKSKIILSELLDKAGFNEYRINVVEDYPNIILNVESPDSNLLIGKMGQTLEALQYLIDKLLKIDDKSEINVIVDIENYRKRVIENLKERAIELAKRVVKTKKVEKLPPMIPMVRKEIHNALKEIPGVRTESYGDGNIKTIYIIPEDLK